MTENETPFNYLCRAVSLYLEGTLVVDELEFALEEASNRHAAQDQPLCMAGNGGVLRCALPADHDGAHRIGAEDVPRPSNGVPAPTS